MATGMWVSASGAQAQAQSVDTIANNLANADTLGFKKDLPTFKEYLTTVEREHSPEEVPRGPIKEKEFYPLDGRDQAFVVVDGTHTSFKPGSFRVTQGQLDVAMDGPGFLEVSTPNGIRYTRQGSLKIAQDGRLVTNEGYPVLSAQPGGLLAVPAAANVQPNNQGGLPTQGGVAAGLGPNRVPGAEAARFINLKDRGNNITISPSGDIYSGDNSLGKMSVVEFKELNKLHKLGSQLFENLDPTNVDVPQKTQIRQGILETSNVNPIEEMTNLIKANRLFENDLKAMKTYGELLGKEANDIGKL